MGWQRGQAYGQDLRDRVLSASGSIREIAARYSVSESYVVRARSRQRRLGDERPGVQRNHVPLRLSGLEEALLAHVAEASDQTLDQWRAWVQAEHGVAVGRTTMWKTLGRLGVLLKKKVGPCGRARTR